MKRVFTLCCCMIMLMTITMPVSAMDNSHVIDRQETALGDGISVVDEIIEYAQIKSTDKTFERKRTFTDDGTVIAIIAFRATFRYDGTTVQVLSKSVTQTDTYEGWNYSQNSFTANGGTVTLNAKLTKLLVFNQSFTMTLACDKNGNISY